MDASHNLEERIKPELARLKSAGERQIAATLTEYGIPYVYEPTIHVNDNGINKRLRPDFYLPNHNLIVEYFGRIGNQNYDQRTQKKLTLYRQNNIEVLPVYPWTFHQDWPSHLLHRVYFGPKQSPSTNTQPTYTHSTTPNTQRSYRPTRHTGYTTRPGKRYR